MTKPKDTKFIVNQQMTFARAHMEALSENTGNLHQNAVRQSVIWQLCGAVAFYLIEIQLIEQRELLAGVHQKLLLDKFDISSDVRFKEFANLANNERSWFTILCNVEQSLLVKRASQMEVEAKRAVEANIIAVSVGAQTAAHWMELDVRELLGIQTNMQLFVETQREAAFEC